MILGFQLLALFYEGFFSGFVQKRIKPVSSGMVKTGKNQAEKNTLEKTANLASCGGLDLTLVIVTMSLKILSRLYLGNRKV